MTPFSLADLGLNDDELAFFDQAQTESASAAAEPTVPSADQEPDMTPFALADLGLNDDELAFFDQAQTEPASAAAEPTTPATPEADLTPFAFADMSEAEHYSHAAESAAPSDADLDAPAQQAVHPTDLSPLPMSLPEGAQSVASAAEYQEAIPQQSTVKSSPVDATSPQDLAAFHALLATDPENDVMRLAVARMSQHTSDPGQAVEHYKQLIKRGQLLDEVVGDLEDAITDADDAQLLRRLHRVLGDAYMKQNRFREAMDEYSWTLARSS
jgi:tetratricopeptide (TPR) repeat protein